MNIEQKKSIEILTNYWYEKQKEIRNIEAEYIFVGDVHGDFNQLISPLIYSNLIRLNGKVRKIYESEISNISDVYIPEYELNKIDTKIFYLGDYVDEGIYSRNIVCFLQDICDKCENICLIIGNHDANILGRYLEFKDKSLNFLSLQSYWPTFQKEVSPYSNIHVYLDQVKVDGVDARDFLYDYFNPLFNSLFQLFRDEKLKVCDEISINDEPFIISHTLITNKAIEELKINKTRFSISIPNKPLIEDDEIKIRDIQTYNDGKISVSDVNKLFKYSNASFISSNRLLYNRVENDLWKNRFIVGHSPGGEYEYMGINPIPSKNYNDRLQHTEPIIKNKYKIFYFDLKSSSGYDLDNVSRPDFFYFQKQRQTPHSDPLSHRTSSSGKMNVSNIYALRIFYSFIDNLIKLDEYKGKNKTDGIIHIL